MPTVYPCAPGHEIVGRGAHVGPAVTTFKGGDLVGVGCLGSTDAILGGGTLGGYSASIVVERGAPFFAIALCHRVARRRVAKPPLGGRALRAAHPFESRSRGRGSSALRRHHHLLAAAPLGRRQWQEGGAHTVVFTTSESKQQDALRLGAHEILSKNADEMAKHQGSFDFILDTVSAEHDMVALLHQLKSDPYVKESLSALAAATPRGEARVFPGRFDSHGADGKGTSAMRSATG